MDEDGGADGGRRGAGPDGPAREPFGVAGTTEEEQAAILAMLCKRVGCVRAGRGSAWARAGLKLAAVVLLVAGVGVGLGDGDEFDDSGCDVAQRPAKLRLGLDPAELGKADEDRVPGSGGGSGGGAGGDGGAGRLECEVWAQGCMHRGGDGECRVLRRRCMLLDAVAPGLGAAGAGRGEPDRYALRKGAGGWRLVFEGQERFLANEKGLGYVAVLLRDPPQEPIHGAELANRAFGDAVVEERNLATDDRDSVRGMAEARRRCQAVIDDPGASEVERREAQSELEAITEWARRHMRGTEGNEQRRVRAIRQAIRRLVLGLGTAVDEGGRPDPVLRGFGAHLERYLVRPSGRGGRRRDSRVRAGLAGRFTYEAPEGVEWGA